MEADSGQPMASGAGRIRKPTGMGQSEIRPADRRARLSWTATNDDDCRKAGLHPIVCSGYRSKEKQQILFDEKCNEYLQQGYSRAEAHRAAEEWVALPGTSEHHLGMAVDIVAESYQFLDRRQEETAEQQWMMAHSWEYGFILRYPTGKSSLTGIQYEPWHYRYVGRAAAAYITQNHLCLEEYLSIIMPAGWKKVEIMELWYYWTQTLKKVIKNRQKDRKMVDFGDFLMV